MAKIERPKMGDALKQIPDVATPIQEVRPVAQKPESVEEERINFNAPVTKAREIKSFAANSGMSIKELMIVAFDQYVSQLSK